MNLLIADDDPVSRAALRSLIGAPEGWRITEVSDGQAALDTLCDGLGADLCIIDLNMPRVGGLELLQRIRRDPVFKSIKVVITSAARDRETILTLAKLQISGYLLKPYDEAKAKAVLKPLLPQTAVPFSVSRTSNSRPPGPAASDQ